MAGRALAEVAAAVGGSGHLHERHIEDGRRRWRRSRRAAASATGLSGA
jgi:hypothetical protein